MDCISEPSQFRYNLGPEPELVCKRKSALRYRSVCNGCHSHSSGSNARMVVEERFGRAVPVCHVFKRSRAYCPVPYGKRAYFAWCEKFRFHGQYMYGKMRLSFLFCICSLNSVLYLLYMVSLRGTRLAKVQSAKTAPAQLHVSSANPHHSMNSPK